MRGREKRERQDHSACRATQGEKEELKDWFVQKEEAGVDSLTMLLFGGKKKSPSENASAVNFVEISLRVQMSAVEKESKRARDTTGTGV